MRAYEAVARLAARAAAAQQAARAGRSRVHAIGSCQDIGEQKRFWGANLGLGTLCGGAHVCVSEVEADAKAVRQTVGGCKWFATVPEPCPRLVTCSSFPSVVPSEDTTIGRLM